MALTLILFDIDGTLTATGESDARCFAVTFQKVFGGLMPSTDWHDYEHVTDSGVIGEILKRTRGTWVTDEELARFSDAFVEELQRDYASDPRGYSEIPGARALMDRLRTGRDGFPISLATGCMRGSAYFKLGKAGIDGRSMPGGFANDAISRADIARAAIASANSGADDIVYVGDGVWDAKTARDLGMRFIGVTRESCPVRLREHGATICLDDFLDQDLFFDAVRDARVPGQDAAA